MMLSKKRRNDIVLLICVLIITALFATVYFFTRRDGSYAAVIKDGTEIARYSLIEECEVPIMDGKNVTNTLVIENGSAYISNATCPDQICVNHRAVSKIGETIVCLPNKIVIKIIGADNTNVPDMVV